MNGVRLKFSHDKSSNNNYLYNIFSYTDGSIKLKWFDRKGSLNDWARMNEIGIVLCRPSVHSFHAAQRKPTLPTDRAIQTCSAHRHRKLGSLLHDGFVWQPARTPDHRTWIFHMHLWPHGLSQPFILKSMVGDVSKNHE